MFEENDYSNVTFTYNEVVNGVSSHVTRNLTNKHAYDEVVEQFVWFLQNMGFSYISGLAVLDEDGNEIYNTLD